MGSEQKVLVVIPTYNECLNVKRAIDAILTLNQGYHILIVDDNSPDGTGKIAEELASEHPEVQCLIRTGPRGRGLASIEGYHYCLDNGYRCVCEIDCDLSHDPEDIIRMVEMSRDCDVVAGSRYVEGGSFGNYPFHRRLISRAANLVARIILGIKVKDATQSFRFIKRNVLEELLQGYLISSGFSITVETNYRATRARFRICEMPIRISDRLYGTAKMNFREVVRFARAIVSIRLGLRRVL